MIDRNICKCNPHHSGDIVCTDFILETCNALSATHSNDHYILGLVLRGEGVLHIGARTESLVEGCLFLVEKHQDFSIDASQMEFAYIRFRGRRAEEQILRLPDFPKVCVYPNCNSLSDLWQDALSSSHQGNVDLLSEAVLLYSFARIIRKERQSHQLINRMIRITHDRFADPAFSLSVLAEGLGYDPKYLSSYFCKKRGIRFTEYLRELRIKHAVFLMEQGVVSVKNIAILSGFEDALYFSKVFKETMGTSPKNYIEQMEKKFV